MDFGTTIRQSWTIRGLTQRTLVEQLQHAGFKVNITSIDKIENNWMRLPPSTDLICALAGKVDIKAVQARLREIPELG